MKFHIQAIFNAIIAAATESEAREKFVDKALTESPFHLEASSIEIDKMSGGKQAKK